MTTHRAMKGVLHNFLSSYTSRYSDFHGYWLFGFLVDFMERDHEFSLISTPDRRKDQALQFAELLAFDKFKDQVTKAGLRFAVVRDARIHIHRAPNLVHGLVNGWASLGYEVEFAATAQVDTSKVYKSLMTVFVAPHNPAIELRRARDKWLGNDF